MVSFLFYLLLGISQGVLEWLPVSSEGSLILLQTWYGIPPIISFKIALWLHIGTLGAVIVAFPREWKNIFFEWKQPVPERRFLILTTLGTAIVGLPVRFFLVKVIGESNIGAIIIYLLVGIALLVTGLLLRYSREFSLQQIPLEDLGIKGELLAGFAQGFTIIPGISRSGTTVSALLFLKVESEDSFRGSFLMSVPAVLGAVVLETYDLLSSNQNLITEINFLYLSFSILAAFVLGLLTIKVLLKFAHDFNFSTVVLVLGSILVILGVILLFQ